MDMSTLLVTGTLEYVVIRTFKTSVLKFRTYTPPMLILKQSSDTMERTQEDMMWPKSSSYKDWKYMAAAWEIDNKGDNYGLHKKSYNSSSHTAQRIFAFWCLTPWWGTDSCHQYTLTCLYVPSSRVSRCWSGAGVLSLNLVRSRRWMARNCTALSDKSSSNFFPLIRSYKE